MEETIRVHLVRVNKLGGKNQRPYIYMRYTDPETGKRVTKSTGTASEKKALKVAGAWEDDLRAGRYQRTSNPTWEEFRTKFEDDVLNGKSQHTFNTTTCVFNRVAEIVRPERLRHLTTDRVGHFVKELRREKKSEQTIRTYLKNLFWALRWAKKQGMLAKLPAIDLPGNEDSEDDVMKGRPITLEEFERMLDAIPKAFTPKGEKQQERLVCEVVPAWTFYLKGLWTSGLRLAESLNLYWDREDRIQVDLSGRRPMLVIPKGMQKNKRSTVLPMAPEFARLLETVPADERTGPVFRLRGLKLQRDCRESAWVGTIVRRIGQRAKVVVQKSAATGKVKYASAHDLRRSFGERWASRVMPKVLKELMRHRSIETTMRYYVGENAQKTAEELWTAFERCEVSIQVSTADSGDSEAQKESRNPLQEAAL